MINRTQFMTAFILAGFIGIFLGATALSAGQARTKKQNMTEMGEQFGALNRMIIGGAARAKFGNEDFERIDAVCEAMGKLANEYAGLESDKELATISTSLAGSVEYVREQANRRDPLVLVVSAGQTVSFCAECHYRDRW